jgi:SAM-dependent methyltransferase
MAEVEKVKSRNMKKTGIDIQKIVEQARASFERDLLTPGYSRIISDDAHLANIIRFCRVVSGKSYLDIGTGSGYLAFELARRNPSCYVTGIDIVEPVIAAGNLKAVENGLPRLNFLCFAGIDLPFDDGRFYGALSRYAFHHFPSPDFSVREVHRILEPGGFCMISDPMADPEDDLDFMDRFSVMRNDGHVRYYRDSVLVDLFEKAGFTTEKRFDSSITFPRIKDDRSGRLLAKTPGRILDLYKIRLDGDKIYSTMRVMNIYFKKPANGPV